MLKKLFLQKGWAGKTITRLETIDRINPLIRQHIVLNRSYDDAEKNISNREFASKIVDLQKKARMNVGKLVEIVFSSGGVAYSGTDIEPSSVHVGEGDDRIVETLAGLEGELLDAVRAESKIEHHMRTRAVLQTVERDAADRLKALSDEK